MGTLIVLMLWISCNMGIEILVKKVKRAKKQKRGTVPYKKGMSKNGRRTADNGYGDFTDFQMSA